MVTKCNYLLFFYGRTSRELAEQVPGHPLFKLQLHYSGDFWKSCKTMGGSKSKFTKLCS